MMLRRLLALFALVLLIAGAVAYFDPGKPRNEAAESLFGADPKIPPPQTSLIPVLNWAGAEGWSEGAMPKPAPGLTVNAFASGLSHPRSLLVLPNGDVLAAESATRPDTGLNPVAWLMNFVRWRAGGLPASADRITRLRDGDGDGVAEQRDVILDDLDQPFGMVFLGETLYVANTGSLMAFPFALDDLRVTGPGRKLLDMPTGYHWTRNLTASADGSRLYVTIGSGSNIAEGGMKAEDGRGIIVEVDLKAGTSRVFASGLRNANGMAWVPDTGALWTVVNERDGLGDETPPDYLTSVADGGFYGWPWSYWGANIDPRVTPPNPEMVSRALVPDYALGGHTAPLGLAWLGDEVLPGFMPGMAVALHGSWNRSQFAGYKVILVPFENGRPSGAPLDLLTGFLDAEGGRTFGRPVAVAVARDGAVLVADDAGNTIWRLTSSQTFSLP